MHEDELIELYALGSIDEREREAVEEHVAVCESCRARFLDAVDVVANLEEAEMRAQGVQSAVQRTVLTLRRQFGALAAALVLVAAGSIGYALIERGHQPAVTSEPLAAIVSSHFFHAAFASVERGAPSAKVLYARDGSWLYVIANADASYRVVGTVDGTKMFVGTTESRNGESTLFVRPSRRYGALELTDGKSTLSRAVLVYASAASKQRSKAGASSGGAK